MKITKINLSKLHNEEHFQFHTEFKNEINGFGPQTLNIETEFARFLPLYDQEGMALLLIRKSVTTDQLAEGDNQRDDIFRGLVDAVNSGLNHFNPDKRMAAARLKVLFDRFGNVARKPYNEETAAIRKLTQESRGVYAEDVSTLSLNDWFTELDTKNIAFDMLMKSRYSEEAGKTELRMNKVRLEVDAAYRGIVDLINALMLVNGTDKYEAFVRELNARVEKYNAIVAIRMGRNAKGTDSTESNAQPTA